MARQQWLALSSDKWILDVVCSHVLEFDELPLQFALPRPLSFSESDRAALDAALLRFEEQGIVERCEPSPGNVFYSNVFPTVKKDGTTARVILNLKELNPYVTHTHFKIDSFKDVVRLVQPQCFFMTIDFQDAYYSVYVRSEERKIIKIQELGRLLLKDRVSLWDLASFNGLAVVAEPAVNLAPVRYKYLEIIRNRELARHHGDYDARVPHHHWYHKAPVAARSRPATCEA
ncbi:hypothetical protein E2C01_035799 [Portunus trituberculatus]|uniref:Reverse transcriptase domain-containing protein n=1 Tax=Portunus trituberculatus TaxID=210409 RepID=A0A5B7F9B3_PORTR|nr:hypothetical protein [Portunus trituberculatus]